MEPKESNQYSVPNNAPKSKGTEPHLPGEESESILKGARQEDQLENLQPKKEDDKASNQSGASPVKDVNKGEGTQPN